jgi:low temperature requirement protein LtrA
MTAFWLSAQALAVRHCRVERRVSWSELFFDLVFVAAVAQVGVRLADDYSVAGLARYALMLSVIWWAWNGYAMYATRFVADDWLERLLTGLQMVAVIFMAANADGPLDGASSAGFAAAYAVMRLVLVVQYARALAIQEARRLVVESAGGIGIAAIVWLGSALMPAPARYVAWAVAIAVDVAAAACTSRFVRELPPNAHHLPERFGLFTLILLGESIIAIMKGIQAQPNWTLPAASAAFLGIGLVFGLWWWYFDGAAAASHRPVHSDADIRRWMIWNVVHLPVYLGLAATAIGIEHIVRAGGLEPLHGAEAWIFCGAATAVTVALVGLTAVSTAEPVRRTSALSLGLAVLPLACAPIAPLVSPSLVVAALFTLCLCQLAVLPSSR